MAGRVAALVAPDVVMARPCDVSSAHAMIMPEEITLVRIGLLHRAVSYRTISLRTKDSMSCGGEVENQKRKFGPFQRTGLYGL